MVESELVDERGYTANHVNEFCNYWHAALVVPTGKPHAEQETE
jgi:hypothetical protein